VAVLTASQALIRGQVAEAREELTTYDPVVQKVQRRNEEYASARSEVSSLQGELEDLVTPRLNAYMHQHIIPAVVRALPDDDVYLRSLRAHWTDQVLLGADEDTRRRMEAGDYGDGDFFREEMRERTLPSEMRGMSRDARERRNYGRGSRQEVPGPKPGMAEPLYGSGSFLVLTFEGETYEVRDEDFIPEQVFDALRAATYPGTDVLVFTQVDTFSIQAEDVQGVPRRIFRGRAVVDLEAPVLRPDPDEEPPEATEEEAPSGEAEAETDETTDGDNETETER
jgi:hypothetical protein